MSVYISQLPLYTGNTYNGYIIWNDSGETTTYKTLFQQQLITGTGTNSLRTSNAIGASGTDSLAIGPDTNATMFNSIAFGRNVQSTNDFGYAFGGSSTASGFVSIVMGYSSSAGGQYSVMIGAEGNSAGSHGIAMGRFAGATGTNSLAIGVSSVSETEGSSVFGSSNLIRNSTYSNIFGSNNTINTTAGYNYNNIFGGVGNTITGTTSGATMVGTSGRTASADNTTYTENHASFGQSYQGYYDNGSGSTFTINWNNGNTQKMSFTGAGGITCNNTQTGAHYRMVINNPNGYTPTSFTAAGRTIKFNGGSFVVYSGESICELFITNDSVFVNQLGLFS